MHPPRPPRSFDAPAPSVAENLAAIQARVATAAESGQRNTAVAIVAVSKTQPSEAIEAALRAGQRVFGENRVQEAAAKWPPMRAAWSDIELHLIGPLQTNKVKDAVALFDVIETVDREKLARALAAEMTRMGRRPTCYAQINTGEEPQKAGVPPGEADAFIRLCRDELKLPIAGLMCIPPIDEEPALHYALLAEIARRNNLQVLSMGMSADYEIAVRLGATHVRIGTAIFGDRPTPPDPR
ncbi:MAG: YggS family pyridoxal phosphate-dependent enzyme [Dongiaceae bacterium]